MKGIGSQVVLGISEMCQMNYSRIMTSLGNLQSRREARSLLGNKATKSMLERIQSPPATVALRVMYIIQAAVGGWDPVTFKSKGAMVGYLSH